MLELKEWEIKSLKNDLKDYELWIDHMIQNKITACYKRMISWYESIYGRLDVGLTDEEVVNLIVSKDDYNNRIERDVIDNAAESA